MTEFTSKCPCSYVSYSREEALEHEDNCFTMKQMIRIEKEKIINPSCVCCGGCEEND